MPDVNDFSGGKITKKTRYMKINNNGVTTADLKARAGTNPPAGREARGIGCGPEGPRRDQPACGARGEGETKTRGRGGLYVELGGEGEFLGGEDMADLLQHGEQVGVRMGEDYEIDLGGLLVVVVFKEVSG